MPEPAPEVSQDFWRPAHPPHMGIDSVFPAACCANCGTEFAIGARFCYVCGALREPPAEQTSRWSEWLEIDRIREKLGLNLASFLLFIAACTCALGAILSGIVYRATTSLEWQAVQTWRIEWMLASVVALLAGLLLKKPTD
jgi:hypothetical protein